MQYFIVFKAFKALSYWVYIFVQWLLWIIDADLFYSTCTYFILILIPFFYYIHLNFLHYPKFYSFCIILPIFPACPKKLKKPTGLGF